MKKILVIFGTRPEAIKLSPVIERLREASEFLVRVCATAQHRDLLDQALEVFRITPDYDLDAMRPRQSLAESTARILAALEEVLERERPDMVLVQGDTTTTLCGALAGFYRRIPVGHVEAGLRTGDLASPFPEEMNRSVAARMAALHFAPTASAAANLQAEGIAPAAIHITGNTGIDAVLAIKGALESGALRSHGLPEMDTARKLILVTAHRRESFGAGMEEICSGLARLAARGDAAIVFPVHPNPHVRETVGRRLAGLSHVTLLEPVEYVSFVELMRRAYLLITDSGGIQEEAPSLGKPVLVLRDKTERPEAVEAGTVRLVGADAARIFNEASLLLDSEDEYQRMARTHNPYGDGHAGERIVAAIRAFFADRGSDL